MHLGLLLRLLSLMGALSTRDQIIPAGSPVVIKAEPHRELFLGKILQYPRRLANRLPPVIMPLVLILLELNRIEVSSFDPTLDDELRSILQIRRELQ